MKKTWFLLLTIIAALTIFSAYGWALDVSPADVSGSPYDEIVVPINISDVGDGLDVKAFGFTINFDQDVLTFVNTDKAETLSEPFDLVFGLVIAPGQVKVNGALLGTPVNISDDGVLVNLNFTVNPTYKGSSLALTAFSSGISTASTTDATFTITGVITTVEVTPALTDVVAGQTVALTAELLINGAHLDLTSTDDITFVVTSGNGAMGAKSLTDGKVQADYTTDTIVESATIAATENVTGDANQETAVVTSIAGALAILTVSPDMATLTADDILQFTAAGVDANGNATTDIGVITWSGGAGIGNIDAATGLFDATMAGTGTVTATSSIGDVADTSGTITVVNFLINVDWPAAPFYNETGVHLVTSGSEPYQATFTGSDSSPGDYLWILSSVGTIDSANADTIHYTAPATLDIGAGETFKKDTLTLTSATDDNLSDQIDIYIYNPMAVTWPASAVGIALGSSNNGVTASGGTGNYKFQSSDPTVATVGADGGGVIPVALGTCQIQVRDATYGDFTTENGFYAESPQIEIVDPITVTPVTKSLEASGSQTFVASGGKAGGYSWTCDNAGAGTIDVTTGIFTAAAVTTVQTATITATDGYDIEGTATVTIYPTLEIVDKPTTPPTVLAGESSQLNVAGGDDDYTWMVVGPVEVEGGTGATFTFNAPTTGAFAGKYTVTVEDSEGFTDFTNIYVPLAFTPFSKNIDGVDSFLLDVSGADVDARITVGEFINSEGGVISDESTGEYATIAPDLNEVPFIFDEEFKVTFTVTGPADLEELKMFSLRVTVEGDDGLTEENGLNTATSGLYRVLPVVEYSGIVQDENGDEIEDANVQFMIGGEMKDEATTDADGWFEVTDILSPSMISAEYDVIVTANGKLTVNLTTAGWSGERTEPVELIDQDSTITGSAKELGDLTSIADALVECTVSAVKYTAYSMADGSYTLPLPVSFNDLPEETKVRASKAGYEAESLDAAVTIVFNLQALTPSVDGEVTIGTDGGSFSSGTCTVELQEGSVTTDSDVTANADIAIGDDSDYTKYSVKLVEINITDPVSGDPVDLTKPIKLTINFDTANVNPGDFKNGNVVIYHAPTVDDLKNGTNLKSVSPEEIVYEDHINGKICFWVDSLSVFGIGGSVAPGGDDDDDGTDPGTTPIKPSLVDDSDDNRCFIATSAYGSPFESHVKILRNFRDVYLMPTSLGHAFVDTYYRYSPKAAAFIADHEILRAVVCVGLMPVVGISYAALHTTAAQKALIIFFMFSLLAGSCLAIRRLKARKTVTA